MVKKGDAFLIPSGPSHDPERKHPHFICTDPDSSGKVLVVNATTWTDDLCDTSCVLNAGEHESIEHKSWIIYRYATIIPCADIAEGIKNGNIIPKTALAAPVLKRICDGCLASLQTKLKIKNYLRTNL